MKLKQQIEGLLRSAGVKHDELGEAAKLPLTLKLDVIALVIENLSTSNCNNPVYGGFSYRLPFIELISYYNQATDLHSQGQYLPFIKCASRLAERILKAHTKELNNV